MRRTHPLFPFPFSLFPSCLLLALFLTLGGTAPAADSTWIGTPNTSTDFTTAGKWSPSGAVDDDTFARTFNASGTAGLISDDTDSIVPWSAINFTANNGSGFDVDIQRWDISAVGTIVSVSGGVSNNELIRLGRGGVNNLMLLPVGNSTISNNGTGLLTLQADSASGRIRVVTTASTTPVNLTVDGTGNTIITHGGAGVFALQNLEEDNSVHTVNLIKSGSGTLTLTEPNSPTSTTLNAGTLVGLTSTFAFGNTATALNLNGGTLDVRMNSSVSSLNTTVGGNAKIQSDRETAGAGIAHAFGTLAIGANTLTVEPGSTVSSGTAAVGFGATTLSGNATFQVNNGGSANASLTLGAVGQSGTRSVTKAGSGTMILSGANTYTGDTMVSAGTLVVASSSTLNSASTLNVTGGTLDLAAGASGRTVSNNMILGGGTVMASQDNVGSGGTIVVDANGVTHTFTASGTLVVPGSNSATALTVGGGGGGHGGTGGVSYGTGGGGGQVVNGTAQTISGSYAVTVGAGGAGGAINGAGGVAGNPTTIAGVSAWDAAGGGGGLTSGTGGTSGSGIVGGIKNGVAGGGGAGDSVGGASSNAPSGTVGGSGGAGSVGTLTGATYGGGGGGSISGGTGGAGGAGGGAAGRGAAFPLTGFSAAANTGGGGGGGGNAAGGAGGSGLAVVRYAYNPTATTGTVTLSGGIDLQSASTLDAFGSGGLLILGGAMTTSTGTGGVTIASSNSSGGVVRYDNTGNTYLGNTTINSGATLRLGAANVVPDGTGKGNVAVVGTLDLNAVSSETINGLSGSGIVDGTGGTPTLTVGNNDATSTFSGVIQNTAGTLAVTKTGVGTLTLTGPNTYAGVTNVNAGKLLVNGSHTGGGTYTVASGATLGGSGTISASVALNGRISPGNSPGTLTTGSETWTDAGDFLFEINDVNAGAGSNPGWDLLNITGALDISGLSVGGFDVLVTSQLLAPPDTGGNVHDFVATQSYNWLFVDAGSTINAFNSNKFNVVTSAFTNNFTAGYLIPGVFSVLRGDSVAGGNDTQLYLHYQAAIVPEPSSYALGLAGLVAIALLGWRSLRAHCCAA
jgi:autotransporter-associated beta strand protein